MQLDLACAKHPRRAGAACINQSILVLLAEISEMRPPFPKAALNFLHCSVFIYLLVPLLRSFCWMQECRFLAWGLLSAPSALQGPF